MILVSYFLIRVDCKYLLMGQVKFWHSSSDQNFGSLRVVCFVYFVCNIGSRRSLRKLERLGNIGNLFIGLAQLRITEDLFLKSTKTSTKEF